MAQGEPPVAVVTGANRGLGLEVCARPRRPGTASSSARATLRKGTAAAAAIDPDGRRVSALELDVADGRERARDGGRRRGRFGRVDVLVNNAAIHYDTWEQASNAELEIVREALETNLLGAWRTALALLPLLRRSPHARISTSAASPARCAA